MKTAVIILIFTILSIVAAQRGEGLTTCEDRNVKRAVEFYRNLRTNPPVGVDIDGVRARALQQIKQLGAKYIHGNRLEAARRLVEGVDETNLIEGVVETGYSPDFQKTLNMVEFLRSFSQQRDQVRGFSKLYDEMKRTRTMANPLMVEVAYWMKHHVEEGVNLATHEFPEKFLHYASEMHSIVSNALESLAEEVRNGDYSKAVELSQKYSGAFGVIIPKLVQQTYSTDLRNFNSVLNFANSNIYNSHKERVLDALYTEMQRNNHLQTEEFAELKRTVMAAPMMTSFKRKLNTVN